MTARPIKANLPTPSVAHFFTGDAVLDRAAYGDREELMDDLARIMREEIADLGARGCTYLQMDEVPLAVICDPKNMDVVRARGDDPDELIDLYIDAINHSIIDRAADMTVCVHLCCGNHAQGMADGGYEPIAERMFDRLDVDGYFLEYDTPRAGDFTPLRHLPKPKRAVLGLVSTKVPELETVDALKRRIDEATKFIELERLCLSPQCGFASVQLVRVAAFPWTLLSERGLESSRWRSRSGIEFQHTFVRSLSSGIRTNILTLSSSRVATEL